MRKVRLAAVAAIALCVATAQAGIVADRSGDAVVDFATTMDMPLMTVGNPGNAGVGTFGDVDYVYRVGKFEVTSGQYTEFLNAVAATDTYTLYNDLMWSDAYGCKILRSNSSGSYTYSVAPDRADRPVNFVSWADTVRFANWLHNGMPTGAQTLATTEDGSYFLNGATSDIALQAITRQADATYFLLTEDEWYKAAYHKNDGVTANYFDYPNSTDAIPGTDLTEPDSGNNANWWQIAATIGAPYWTTEVGEFENSHSPYGAFDMGGNLYEWSESILASEFRVSRGGAWTYGDYHMHGVRGFYVPTTELYHHGFRIGSTVPEAPPEPVPEPATLSLLALGGLAMLRRRTRVG